ncbi:MAG: hypothetical protein IJB00_06045 [Akkermansia sp.]|nr:hypothetical protein [Akkermansia sp.]
MNLRHITRFTYEFTNFQGWRVAISRQGTTLARYFSDKQYGSPEAAREQALSFRDMVLAEINRNPGMTRDILYKYRVMSRKLQQTKTAEISHGVEPCTAEAAAGANHSESVSRNMVSNLKKLCRYLQLDSAGMLKFSLYLFMLQYGTAAALPQNKQNGSFSPSVAEAEICKLVSESHLQRIIDMLGGLSLDTESPGAEDTLHFTPSSTAPLAMVPAEEIRAKESEPNMHNTSPPESSEKYPSDDLAFLNDESPAQNMSPPRPSPPVVSSISSPKHTPQHPGTQKPILHPQYTTGGMTRNTDRHKSKQIDHGLEYAVPRPPDAI